MLRQGKGGVVERMLLKGEASNDPSAFPGGPRQPESSWYLEAGWVLLLSNSSSLGSGARGKPGLCSSSSLPPTV